MNENKKAVGDAFIKFMEKEYGASFIDVTVELNTISTQYNGRFDLEFLKDGEQVRSAGDGTGAVEVLTHTGSIRLEIGDWVVRKVNGELIAHKEI